MRADVSNNTARTANALQEDEAAVTTVDWLSGQMRTRTGDGRAYEEYWDIPRLLELRIQSYAGMVQEWPSTGVK